MWGGRGDTEKRPQVSGIGAAWKTPHWMPSRGHSRTAMGTANNCPDCHGSKDTAEGGRISQRVKEGFVMVRGPSGADWITAREHWRGALPLLPIVETPFLALQHGGGGGMVTNTATDGTCCRRMFLPDPGPLPGWTVFWRPEDGSPVSVSVAGAWKGALQAEPSSCPGGSIGHCLVRES